MRRRRPVPHELELHITRSTFHTPVDRQRSPTQLHKSPLAAKLPSSSSFLLGYAQSDDL